MRQYCGASFHEPGGSWTARIKDMLYGLRGAPEHALQAASRRAGSKLASKSSARITVERRTPKTIGYGNGPKFGSEVLDQWAYRNGVTLHFSRPRKPRDNASIETFNGTLRTEYLDTHWFGTMAEAKESIEAWRKEYNESRPHRALEERTPNEFPKGIAASRDSFGVQPTENSP